MRCRVIEDVSALFVLKGQQLHIGICAELLRQISRLTVDQSRDMLASNDACFFCCIIDRDGCGTLKAAAFKRNFHKNPSVLMLVRNHSIKKTALRTVLKLFGVRFVSLISEYKRARFHPSVFSFPYTFAAAVVPEKRSSDAFQRVSILSVR